MKRSTPSRARVRVRDSIFLRHGRHLIYSLVMSWIPPIVLKRHPLPRFPMPRLWAEEARSLYLEMICARDPFDRALAATFGVSFEQIKEDRRLLGELQSFQRSLCLDTSQDKADEKRRQRRIETINGIEAILNILFGIAPSMPPWLVLYGVKFQREFLAVVQDWDDDRFGSPNSSTAIAAVVIRLGKLITAQADQRASCLMDDPVGSGPQARSRSKLGYKCLLQVADKQEGLALSRWATREKSIRFLDRADRLREIAEKVGPDWEPSEREQNSMIRLVFTSVMTTG